MDSSQPAPHSHAQAFIPPEALQLSQSDLERAASLKTSRITLVLDGVVDFFNLLSILRTADCFGVLNVWLSMLSQHV